MSQEKELTAEQAAELQEKMMQYYEKQIPFLTKQAEYERLVVEIENARFTRTRIMYEHAQLQYAMSGKESQNDEEKTPEKKPGLRRVKHENTDSVSS